MSPPRLSIESRLQKHIKKLDGCWVFTGSLDKDGYGVFNYGRGKQVRAHRMSYEFYISQIPKGYLVCHKCDNPSCINPSHLFLGSHKDNTQDMIKKDRKICLKGSKHHYSKITETDVLAIRQKRLLGLKLKNIGNEFAISFQTVSSICKGKTWKHI
jgi:hypothetical protein